MRERTPRRATRLREAFDHGDHLLTLIAQVASETHELANLLYERRLLNCSRDSDSSTTSEIKQSLVAKDMESPDDRVLIDAEDLTQVDGWWQSLPRANFAFGNCTPNLGGHLRVKGHFGTTVDVDKFHDTS